MSSAPESPRSGSSDSASPDPAKHNPSPEQPENQTVPAQSGKSQRGLFRKVVIVLIVLTTPVILYLATQYGEVQSVNFARALEIAAGRTEIEPRYKLVIDAIIFVDQQHPLEIAEGTASFYAHDRDGTLFLVSYDGGEKLDLRHGMEVTVAGHTHEGNPPWFHCSEVISDY